jgi:hypothetical protein
MTRRVRALPPSLFYRTRQVKAHEAVTLFRPDFYDEVPTLESCTHRRKASVAASSCSVHLLGVRHHAGVMPASDWPYAPGRPVGVLRLRMSDFIRFASICKAWAFLSSTTLSTRDTFSDTMPFSPWVLSSYIPLPSRRLSQLWSKCAAQTALTAISRSLVAATLL